MPIELQTYASGDTDYIAKLNANVAAITDAFAQLETQVGAVSGGDALTVGMFFDTLFNRADGLIGPGSYKPALSATTATIAPGGVFLVAEHSVVASFNNVPISFIGQPSGTYYIVVDTAGTPSRKTTMLPGTVYSIPWNGSGFSGAPTAVAPIFFDAVEADAGRKSVALGATYPTLDARLEAGEVRSVKAEQDADSALAIAYELQAAMGGVSIRKIGITVDGTTGVKGAIQVDFQGSIIGWSVIADVIGDLQVTVSRKASSAPPAAPQVPDAVVDKISASAPIVLAGQKSAARGTVGVSTWFQDLEPWDVVQFNVTAVSDITRATLYLRVQEQFPSPPEIPGFDVEEPLPPTGVPEPPSSPPDFLSPPEFFMEGDV